MPERAARSIESMIAEIDRKMSEQVNLILHHPDCVLVGHSLGGILALQMAADPRGARLSGIETAGVPIRFDSAGMDMLRTGIAAMRGEGAPFMPKPARDQLKGMGVVLEDGPTGTSWRLA